MSKPDKAKPTLIVSSTLVAIGFNFCYYFIDELWTTFFIIAFVLFLILLVGYLFFVVFSVIQRKRYPLLLKLMLSSLVITAAIFINRSGVFESPVIIEAILKDDLYALTLVLREDNSCSIRAVGMFDVSSNYHGEYELKGDTIIFKKKPYDNNFIPDTVYIHNKRKIIFRFSEFGVPDTSFASYFSIQSPKSNFDSY
jgi:hypothetical protein